MILLDSTAWIECLTGGPLSPQFSKYLKDLSQIITPSIVLYEVYKTVKREKGEGAALNAVAIMQQTNIINLDEFMALSAADISLKHSLPMADAVIYTAGIETHATIVTCDGHFKGLDGVLYFAKT
jgi:predicted nucleic acid-binding protein